MNYKTSGMPIGYLLITVADAILKLLVVRIGSSNLQSTQFLAGLEPTIASNRLIGLKQIQKKDKNFRGPESNYQF